MSDVLGLVLPLFGLIFIGYAIARVMREPLEALGWMNIFIIYVALPALFIQLLSKTPVEQLTEWSYILGSIFSTFLIFSIMFLLSVWRSGGDVPESTIKGLAAAYGNIGYMGPGLALIIFGEAAAIPVALILCFENIMHFTLTPLLMAVSRDEGGRPLDLAWSVVRSVVLNPLILGVAAGVAMAWAEFTPPEPLERLFGYLAAAAAPCALFAMGVSLAKRPLTRIPTDMGLIVALKLIVHPLLAYVVLSWVGNFSEIWLYSAVLLYGLPTATNVFILAQQYGVWIQRASASVLLTTLGSIVSVTALTYAIRSGLLAPDLFP